MRDFRHFIDSSLEDTIAIKSATNKLAFYIDAENVLAFWTGISLRLI